jgi:urea transport system substrate-binding protein
MMAWTEAPVVDATLLAIDEINQRGGICGRPIEAIVADGRSNETVFAREAERLIATNNVSVLFGCWTSASRKAVLPILECHNHLLFYPAQYEGLEQSPNVVYTGAAPNQQIIPAIRWAFGFLGARRFFLVGWNSIYSWAAHEIIRDEIAALGGEIVGEAYLTPDGVNVPQTVRRIVQAKPDLIINSVVGDLNLLHSRVLQAAGITPQKTPTLYLSVSELELMGMSTQAVGDFAAWNYFQTVDRPENHAFVSRFRSKYGPKRVIADSMEAGYISVNVWAKAAGAVDSNELSVVRKAILDQSFEAPEGPIRIDPGTQHTWKTMRLGQILDGGQFDIIWSSEKPIRPEPFPASRSKREWANFLARCYKRWGGRWTPSGVAGMGHPRKA